MYAADTILVLKEQRDPDPETGEEFPYNRVRVVNQSPVSHGHKGEWTGPEAQGVIIVPLSNFGSTLDEPFGKLKRIYDVEEIPELVPNVPGHIRVIQGGTAQAGPTPEEVFADKAPGVAREKGQRRVRRPLGEPGGPEANSPLDAKPKARTRKTNA